MCESVEVSRILYLYKMMYVFYLFLFMVFCLYAYFTLRMTRNIKASPILSDSKKMFHIVMVWLIPFAWYYLVKGLIISNMTTMTKGERNKINGRKGGFYESGKGIYG